MKQLPANHFTSFIVRSRVPRTIRWIVAGLIFAALSAASLACGAPASPPTAPAPTAIVPIATTAATSTLVASPTLAATTAAPPTAAPPTLAPVATRPAQTAVPTLAPTAAPPPLVAGPTPPCAQPILTLGTTKFRIESIARAADGSVAVPANTSDVAYWVAGSPANYVFSLSPAANNLALKSKLKSGDPAKIVWGDCSTEDYVVKSVENAPANVNSLFDPAAARVSVFVQSSGTAEGFLVKAGRPEPQAQATPEPTEENAIDAELSFLDTKAAPDGKTVTMSIALKNTGSKSISLAAKDISLTAENAAPLTPLSVDPGLPQEVKPGASVNLRITFTKPAGNTAVFKLLSFSADIYF